MEDTDPLESLLFAGDQVVIAKDEQDMTYMLNNLFNECNKCGLNMDKTQYMMVGGNGRGIFTTYATIQNVTCYEYLGVTTTSDSQNEQDNLKKVGKARARTKKLHLL